MKERRETLCRLVQIPRQKVKTPPKTYPRRIFKEARDAGGGAFLADPLLYGKGKAPCMQKKAALQGRKTRSLAAMQRGRKPERRASIVGKIALDLDIQASGIVGDDVVNGPLDFSLVFLIGQGIGGMSEAVEALAGEIVMLLVERPPRIELKKGIKGIVPGRKRAFCHTFTTFSLRRGRSWKRSRLKDSARRRSANRCSRRRAWSRCVPAWRA